MNDVLISIYLVVGFSLYMYFSGFKKYSTWHLDHLLDSLACEDNIQFLSYMLFVICWLPVGIVVIGRYVISTYCQSDEDENEDR